MFIGFGTVANVATVVIGSLIGMALGHRLPRRTRDTVTDALGLVTMLIGALSAIEVTNSVLSDRVGSSAPVLIVLGALLIGGIVGSLLDLERRLAGFGDWLRARLTPRHRVEQPVPGETTAPGEVEPGGASVAEPGAVPQTARERFIEGFVTASLVFCIGPLTILGALSDGLGRGADQLLLKAVLDGFASIAFAASLGIGVLASALVVGVVQGALTLIGLAIGDFLPEAHLLALTATGGLLLVGLGIRLLNLRQLPVANLLPALLVAPLLVQLVAVLR